MLRKITRSNMSVIGPFAKKKPCGAEQSVPLLHIIDAKVKVVVRVRLDTAEN